MPLREQFNSNEEYNEYFRKYREKNREKIRIYNREYNKKWRKEYGYFSEKKWKINNKNKLLAQLKLRKAINDWKIKRIPCEVCGNEKSHGHHNNYDKPLEVVWLCAKHHSWTHINFKEKELKKINKEKLLTFLKKLDEIKI